MFIFIFFLHLNDEKLSSLIRDINCPSNRLRVDVPGKLPQKLKHEKRNNILIPV